MIMLSENMKKKKSIEETEMYADYEIQWGDPSNWPDEIVNEFDEKWIMIQKKYEASSKI